jgi:hypothetical protein
MSDRTAAITDYDEAQDLDRIWENVPNETVDNTAQSCPDVHHPPAQIYGAYTAAVTGDPVSVFTDLKQVKDC